MSFAVFTIAMFVATKTEKIDTLRLKGVGADNYKMVFMLLCWYKNFICNCDTPK